MRRSSAALHGEETAVYGDKAYADEGRRQAALGRGIDWRVNRKARRGPATPLLGHVGLLSDFLYPNFRFVVSI